MNTNMVYADTRYQLQRPSRIPLPGKNVTDLQEKILIAIQTLSQATTIQIADWLGYNRYHIGKTLSSLKPQEGQTESYVFPLRANTRLTQIHGSVPAIYTLGALG